MVLQETWLKTGYGKYLRPDATEEEMIMAAKEANAHGFIERMPDGYDTIITEGGGNLSKYRNSYFMCKDHVAQPPMLILDEATSSIDTMTEIRIQKAFETMMRREEQVLSSPTFNDSECGCDTCYGKWTYLEQNT